MKYGTNIYTLPYQKYSYTTKYTCSESTKYLVGSKDGIEICRYQRVVVLPLTLVEIHMNLGFHEVLIY